MEEGRDKNVSMHLDGGEHPKLKNRKRVITDEQLEKFFQTLAETCNVSHSCKTAGISAQRCYEKRKDDAAFRQRWGEALAQGYAKLELALLERALVGSEKTTTVTDDKGGAGETSIKTTTVTEYPNALAMSLLKMHRDTVHAHEESEIGETEVEEARERIIAKLERIKAKTEARDAKDKKA